jgi:putative ABC transport system permease protein
VQRMPLVNMALRNLEHQRLRIVFALVALFVGVVAIGYAGAALDSGHQRLEARRGSTDGFNLFLFAPATARAEVDAAVAASGVADVRSALGVRGQITDADGKRIGWIGTIEAQMTEHAGWDVQIEGATEWDHAAEAVYLPARVREDDASIRIGQPLLLRVAGSDSLIALRLAGFYEPTSDRPAFDMGMAALVNESMLRNLPVESGSLRYTLGTPVHRLDAVAAQLGERLPQAMLMSKHDLNELRARTHRSIFTLVAVMAGLALVAGAVLIANAVGLAMFERRREMGVFKALGYTRARVLRAILLENALLGGLAGVSGMAAVWALVALTNLRFPLAQLQLSVSQAAALIGASVGFALIPAALAAWRPTGLRPLEVLRNE